MAYYNIQHISILIDLLLVKEQLKRDYGDLKKLLRKVEEDADFEKEEDRTGVEYLSKLNNRITEELEKGKETIQVKDTCLTNCIDYLGYDSFKDLSIQIVKVQQQVRQIFKKKSELAILLPENGKRKIVGAIEESEYEEPHLSYLDQYYNSESPTWDEEVLSAIKERATVWFVPASLYKEQLERLKELMVQEKVKAQVLPFIIAAKERDLKELQETFNNENLLGGEDDLMVLVQVLLKHKHNQKLGSEQIEPTSNVLIKDPNTVVLGDMKVEGEYISGRDMIFNQSNK